MGRARTDREPGWLPQLPDDGTVTLAVPAVHFPQGRAATKGGIGRALALVSCLAALLIGAGLIAKAAYVPIKAELAQVLLERAFERSIVAGRPIKPWSWADTGPVARIAVPRLGISEIVLSGGSGEAMAFGPGVVIDDKAASVTVIAAHRDTHFTFLRDLQVGDGIALQTIGAEEATYRVERFETLRWDAFTYPSANEDALIALVTCYPFDTHRRGPLRRVAWARRISG